MCAVDLGVSARVKLNREYSSQVSALCDTVAYKVILEPGIGQFREFESPRLHTRMIYIRGDFCLYCAQVDLRKARERGELATLDKNSTSSGIAEPHAQ